MRVLSRPGVRAMVVIGMLALPRGAAADPVLITSGHIDTLIAASLVKRNLVGDGFSLRFGADAFAASLSRQCWPCTAGTMVDLGAVFSGPRASGSGHVDGVDYSLVFLEMTGRFGAGVCDYRQRDRHALEPVLYSGDDHRSSCSTPLCMDPPAGLHERAVRAGDREREVHLLRHRRGPGPADLYRHGPPV